MAEPLAINLCCFDDINRVLTTIYQNTLARNESLTILDNCYFQYQCSYKNAQKLSDQLAEVQNKEKARQQIETLCLTSIAPATYFKGTEKHMMHIQRLLTSIFLQSSYNKLISSNLKSYQHCAAIMEYTDIPCLIGICNSHEIKDVMMLSLTSNEYKGSIVEKQVKLFFNAISTPNGCCVTCLYKILCVISRERINVRLRVIGVDLDNKIFYEGPEFFNKTTYRSFNNIDELMLSNIQDSYFRKLMSNNVYIRRQIQIYMDSYSIRKGLILTRVESADGKKKAAAKKKKKAKPKIKEKGKANAKAKTPEVEYEILPLDSQKEKNIETQMYSELEMDYIMSKLYLKKNKLIIIDSAISIQRSYRRHMQSKRKKAAKYIYQWYKQNKQRKLKRDKNIIEFKQQLSKHRILSFIRLSLYKIKIRKYKYDWARIMKISQMPRDITIIQAMFRAHSVRNKYSILKQSIMPPKCHKIYRMRHKIRKEWELRNSKLIAAALVIHFEREELIIQKQIILAGYQDSWDRYEKALRDYCFSEKSAHMKNWVKQKGKGSEEYWLNLDTMAKSNSHPGKLVFERNKENFKKQADSDTNGMVESIENSLEYLEPSNTSQRLPIGDVNAMYKRCIV